MKKNVLWFKKLTKSRKLFHIFHLTGVNKLFYDSNVDANYKYEKWNMWENIVLSSVIKL